MHCHWCPVSEEQGLRCIVDNVGNENSTNVVKLEGEFYTVSKKRDLYTFAHILAKY
jgi:hypothetical protein